MVLISITLGSNDGIWDDFQAPPSVLMMFTETQSV